MSTIHYELDELANVVAVCMPKVCNPLEEACDRASFSQAMADLSIANVALVNENYPQDTVKPCTAQEIASVVRIVRSTRNFSVTHAHNTMAALLSNCTYVGDFKESEAETNMAYALAASALLRALKEAR